MPRAHDATGNSAVGPVKSFVELLSAQAERRRDEIAYRFLLSGDVDGDIHEVTFGGLEHRSRAIGGWLQEHGLAGTRALLVYPDGLEFIRGYLGCLFSGVVAIPCPAPVSGQMHRVLPRLQRLVANAEARLVLTTGPILAALRDAIGHAPELAALTWAVTEDMPDQAADAWRDPCAGPDSLAFLQYTSGSTSAPRGVMVSHGNLLDNQRIITDCTGHTPDRLAEQGGDLMVSWLPVFHDMGLIMGMLHAVYTGYTVDLFSPMRFLQKPERWLKAVSAYRAHTSGAPNFAYELCLRQATPELLEQLDLTSWQVAFNGAEPVRPRTLRRFAEAFAPAGFRPGSFYPAYGLAEATLMVSGPEVGAGATIGLAPAEYPGAPAREVVGVGHPRMTTVIVDPEAEAPRLDGEVGEIWLNGPSVALGYWNDPVKTEETFNARLAGNSSRFLRTGDLGFIRDGELFISGRRKDMLIVDGRNHYPQDLELTAELAHPAVRGGCTAAFAPGAAEDEQPVLVAEVSSEDPAELAVIDGAIRAAIAQEHGLALRDVALIRPGTIFKTSSGKIQRSACQKAHASGKLARLDPAGPAPDQPAVSQPAVSPPSMSQPAADAASIESWLADAVARRAGIDPARISGDQPVAEYGLGSRAMVEVVGELSQWLGRPLEPTVLYEYPTIAGAARAFSATVDARPQVAPSPPAAEPIAIVGMACRFPGGADNPEALWQLLAGGIDVVGDPPPGRWDTTALYDPDPGAAGRAYTLQGGYLTGIDRFDAAFFGISPREAAAMDPQQRLLLQTAWEALERAGIIPKQLQGSAAGVYIGMYNSDYLAAAPLDQLDGHVGTGSAASVASGRIAYTLGLEGPAVTIDTACSSSLVALHLAVQALRGGECDLALGGGVTVMPTPRALVEFSRLQALSASGRCQPFAATADGMVWAEGCGLLVLKRLTDAQRDGDSVLAVIRSSSVNQDGRSQGLSAPNGLAQERVIRAALVAAGLEPHDIDYVEAHGTGTPLGDPVEGRALARVFGGPRLRPLSIGSLKSNLGHTQAAAGVAGVIKAVLALQHGQLPASLHASEPTTQVDWAGSRMELLRDARPWAPGARVRRAGVSGFGISGTNAHLIVEEAPAPVAAGARPDPGPRSAPARFIDDAPVLFPLSARSVATLRGQAGRLVGALSSGQLPSWRPVAGTLAHHRTHFEQRAVILARSQDELLAGLRGLAAGPDEPPGPAIGPGEALVAGRVAFVFPGQGSQWAGMAADLLRQSAVFARELARCDEALRAHTGWSATAVLREDQSAPSLDRVDVVQPVLFAVTVALAALWRSFGVEPDAVIGHSQGEVAAACVCGALSLPDAARVVALRSRAVATLAAEGAMAVVDMPRDQLDQRLDELGGRVAVAAVNSRRSTVVAGPGDTIDELLAGLEEAGTFARRLSVSYASHTAHMDRLREVIHADLAAVTPAAPAIAWYSTVLGQRIDEASADAGYWFRNVREPVRYAQTAARMIKDGFRFFVELSPHPSLLVALQTIAEDAGRTVAAVGSLRRGEESGVCLARALGELHVAGMDLHWDRLVADARADLPTYAFAGERHWIEPSAASQGEQAGAAHPLLGMGLESASASRWTFSQSWSAASMGWMADHQVFDQVVLSGTTVLELCAAALEAGPAPAAAGVADLALVTPLVVAGTGTTQVQVEVTVAQSPGGHEAAPAAEISVYSRDEGAPAWTLHATASAAAAGGPGDPAPAWPAGAAALWPESRYAALAEAGLGYGPAFRGVEAAVAVAETTVLARISLPGSAGGAISGRVHPALLDAALQVASVFAAPGRTLLPAAIGHATLPATAETELTALVVKADAPAGPDLTIDVTLWDRDGLPAGRLTGVRLREVSEAAVTRGARAARDLHAVRWTPAPTPAPRESGGTPLAVIRPATGRSLDEAASEALSKLQAWLGNDPADPRTLVVVTERAVATHLGEDIASLAGAAVHGLVRSAQAEHPGRFVVVDIDDPDAPAAVFEAVVALGEPAVAVRAGQLLVPRLAPAGAPGALPAAARLAVTEPGKVASVMLVPGTGERPLHSGEVRVAVRAAGLNFRDALLALDIFPGEDVLGAELSGVVLEVAADVTDLAPGDRVMGLTADGIGSTSVTDRRLLTRFPAQWSFAEAAAVPVIFLTAYCALRELAQLAPGQKVLIHTATGGVGHAAIQLARHLGAEVYATASPGKQHVLLDLGVPAANIASSRTLEFASQFPARGLDVVLNSLTGEVIDASAGLLRDGGCFIEMGRTDLRDPAAFAPRLTYHALELLDLDPAYLQRMLGDLSVLFDQGVLAPPPLTAWDARHAAIALDRLAHGRHTGKYVLVFPRPLDPAGTVLITGGTGALAIETARHLVRHHQARHLLLASRTGSGHPQAAPLADELRAIAPGVQLTIASCDVSDADAVRHLLASIDPEHPLTAVVHAAGALHDAPLDRQTDDTLRTALAPKASAADTLHALTRHHDLAAFVVYASAAGTVGNAGQANYSAANAYLDALAQHRAVHGYPATSIAWGLWAQASGLTAGLSEADQARLRRGGLAPLTTEHGLELLDAALLSGQPAVLAAPLDRPALREQAREGTLPALLRDVAGSPGPTGPAAPRRDDLAGQLARLPAGQQRERLVTIVADEVAHALGLRSGAEVDAHQPLRDAGLDSVTALEVRNRLGARLGSRLPATVLFDYPTVGRLADHLLEVIAAAGSAPHQQALAAQVPVPARSAGDPAEGEPIAVVSLACRLPGGVDDPERLWPVLAAGQDLISAFPAGRWDVASLYDPDPEAPGKSYTREGGFLPVIDAFDARFFGIAAREAAAMDPQQRLLLETTWEALERAGIVPAQLAGTRAGVYLGMFGSEYQTGAALDQLDGYVGTGSALSVASGRLAYTLGLTGPAVTVDTACSSSLMAVHLAAAALRSGECDMALVGGATVMVTPSTFVEFSRLRGLSPSGRCRSFSDDADGTGFSEGVVVTVLKRLGDARRDGDQVLAVVRGTAANQDGRSQGLTVPHGPSQEEVIGRALERSGLSPADIDYVEAHGTGTTLGDPIEANALARVFGPDRPAGRPLYLGSLKSNLGHLQAAAGLAGLMKAVLALQHEQLPQTLHAARPSRHVDWEGSGLRLVHEQLPWPRGERVRRAGVSAFGISGTNVHAILEEAPAQLLSPAQLPSPAPVPPPSRRPEPEPARQGEQPTRLFVVSGPDDDALHRQASALADHLSGRPDVNVADVAYTLGCRRSHFPRRAAVLADGHGALLAGLGDVVAGRAAAGVVLPPAGAPLVGRVAFVFPGHSPRWAGMAVDLLGRDEAFTEAFTRCDEAIARQAGWSVRAVLRGDSDAPDAASADVTQPLLFAVSCGLAAMWRSFGVQPDAVIGHSLGEIVAAHEAGLLTLDQASALVTRRGRAVRQIAGQGGSLALEATPDEAGQLIAGAGGRLTIAAVNSGRSVTISGDVDVLADLQARCDAAGIPARRVSVDFATHSPQVDQLRAAMTAALDGLTGTGGQVPLYSTVLAEPVLGDALDGAYWFRNLREPVRFADTVRRLIADGFRYFVEAGPHPALLRAIRAVAADEGVPVVAVGSLRRDESGPASMLANLARLFGAGLAPDWPGVFHGGAMVALPTYAFGHDHHWSAPARVAPPAAGGPPLAAVHLEASDEPGRHILQTEIDLRDPRFAYLSEHRVAGRAWLPAAAFLEVAFEAAGWLWPGAGVDLSDVRIEQALALRPQTPACLQLALAPADGDGNGAPRAFTIASRPAGDPQAPWTRHVTGTLAAAPGDAAEPAGRGELASSLDALRARCLDPVDTASAYAGLAAAGIEYGHAFQGVAAAWRGPGDAVGQLRAAPRSPYRLHPAVLDAALQAAGLPASVPSGQAFVPVAVGHVQLTGNGASPAWVTSHLRALSGGSIVADLRLLDDDEQLILRIEGLELAALSPAEGALFEVRWRLAAAAAPVPPRGRWLVLADESGVAAALSERLDPDLVIVARRGPAFADHGAGAYQVDPANPKDLSRLLAAAFPDAPPDRIIALYGLDAPALDAPAAAAEATLACCTATLHLAAALAERSWRPAPRLFLVTRGSQAAGGSDQVTAPQQALTWGFGRTVAQERPELRTTLIDLPPAGGFEALWDELRQADGEPEVALRDLGRLVPRLAPTQPDGAATVHDDRTYLITGGLGGLGRVVAERLAGLGARHIAVVGRREPAADAARWIGELGKRGVLVYHVRADVSDRASLAAALGQLQDRAPAIAGAVHAAGVLDDASLSTLTSERIAPVLAPKVLGTIVLSELLPELDFLVLFASAAGLFGSPGQSSYAAANAFLDAWAHHQAQAGQAVLSLDWGAWAEVGMTVGEPARAAAIARSGLRSFTTNEGGELFERVVGSRRRQLAPVAIARAARHSATGASGASRSLLADLVTSPPGQAAGRMAAHEVISRIRATADVAEQHDILTAYLRGLLGEITGDDMGRTAPGAPLKELGLDSLLLVTLQGAIARELGAELDATQLSGTSISGLATAVLSALPEIAPDSGPGEPAGPAGPTGALAAAAGAQSRPATRDVMRLLRAEQHGTPSAAHHIGFAVRLTTPVTRERLAEIISGLAGRHAALRTGIVADEADGQRLWIADHPGDLLRWSPVGEVDVEQRLRELLEPPFDLSAPPLWRFELAEADSGEQVLLFGAHHAVSDAVSLVLVMAEIDAELAGARLDPGPTSRDIDSLLVAQPPRAAAPPDGALDPAATWRQEFAGLQRLDLTLATPRPATRSFRSGFLFAELADDLLDTITAQANRLAITPAALCLGTLTVYLARLRQRDRFALAIPVDTRMHAGTLDAVGFFGVPVPFAAEANGDEPVTAVLRRTDERLTRLLRKGSSFFDALSIMVAEGLYQPNAPLVEVYFNFIRPLGLKPQVVEPLPASAGHFDLDLMITVWPDLNHLCLEYNRDILNEASTRRIADEYLDLLAKVAGGTEALVRQEAPAAPEAAAPESAVRAEAMAGSVTLAATFALGDLTAMLATALGDAGGERLSVAEAPYHQVLASLRDPAGAFAQPALEAGVVLLRAADLSRFGPVTDELLAELADEYPAALRSLHDRTRRPVVVGFLPSSPGDPQLRQWEEELASRLREMPGIAVLRPGDWCPADLIPYPFDLKTDQLAHLPFGPEFQAAVALKAAATIAAIRRPRPKVIAVDGDNTLWGGVAGELGPEGVDLTGPYATLAGRLLAWRAAGVLLVLVSNNDEATLRRVLERADSPLDGAHFAAISAGWQPKAQRLEAVAAGLGLGLDTFLYLDDDPVQIGAMRAQLPEVLSITCPAPGDLQAFVTRLWPVIPAPATREDAGRAEFYQQEQERTRAREQTSFAEFLDRLQLEVDIEPMSAAAMERSAQLGRRTTQFNLRPAPLDEDALVNWQRDGEVWTVAARDRFGDYGQVGVLVIRPDQGRLEVIAWMLSCRALGRGVEERLLGWLADRAQALECHAVRLIAENTPRNVPARRLVAALDGGDADRPRLEAEIPLPRLRAFRSWDPESHDSKPANPGQTSGAQHD
jgi:FkbH-like protein